MLTVDWRGSSTEMDVPLAQMLNTLLHELGHAFGLHHHLDDESEMMTRHNGGVPSTLSYLSAHAHTSHATHLTHSRLRQDSAMAKSASAKPLQEPCGGSTTHPHDSRPRCSHRGSPPCAPLVTTRGGIEMAEDSRRAEESTAPIATTSRQGERRDPGPESRPKSQKRERNVAKIS